MEKWYVDVNKLYDKHQINIFLMVLESILRSENKGNGIVNGSKFTIEISEVEKVNK
jgi:hypothetical protein